MSQTASAVMYGKNLRVFFCSPELPPPYPYPSLPSLLSPFPTSQSLREPGKSFSIPGKLHKTQEVDNIVCFKFKMQNVYACWERRMKECPFQEPYLK
jgi:hypothetical protein